MSRPRPAASARHLALAWRCWLARRRITRAGGTIVSLGHVEGPPPFIRCDGELRIGRALGLCGRSFPPELHVGRGARLVIGDNCFLNQGATIAAASSITIGDRCLIGELVAIHDTAFHEIAPGEPVRTAPVSIGHNVWLGRGATILPGVTIGDHAVIGAGAVVTRDIPARCVAVGAPAAPRRSFDAPEGWRRA